MYISGRKLPMNVFTISLLCTNELLCADCIMCIAISPRSTIGHMFETLMVPLTDYPLEMSGEILNAMLLSPICSTHYGRCNSLILTGGKLLLLFCLIMLWVIIICFFTCICAPGVIHSYSGGKLAKNAWMSMHACLRQVCLHALFLVVFIKGHS